MAAVDVVGAAVDGVKVADEEVVFGVRILKWVRRKGHCFFWRGGGKDTAPLASPWRALLPWPVD